MGPLDFKISRSRNALSPVLHRNHIGRFPIQNFYSTYSSLGLGNPQPVSGENRKGQSRLANAPFCIALASMTVVNPGGSFWYSCERVAMEVNGKESWGRFSGR